jgi:hypothetical protein
MATANIGNSIVFMYTKLHFDYTHIQANGWTRHEHIDLLTMTSKHNRTTGVEFMTQRGRSSGVHGDWTYDGRRYTIEFNWKGTAGFSKTWSFDKTDNNLYCRTDRGHPDIIEITMKYIQTVVVTNIRKKSIGDDDDPWVILFTDGDVILFTDGDVL